MVRKLKTWSLKRISNIVGLNQKDYTYKFSLNFLYCPGMIDECESDPCLNGGTCEDAVNSYSCSCHSEFTGDRCETNIHSCYGEICKNNGTFVVERDSFCCYCLDGFTGDKCETNIDSCHGEVCENNGTFEIGLHSLHCTCPDSFTGDRCETDIDECVSSPCENGGTCVDDINSFQCTCPDDTTGYRCETVKNNHNLRWILMTVRESCFRMMEPVRLELTATAVYVQIVSLGTTVKHWYLVCQCFF